MQSGTGIFARRRRLASVGLAAVLCAGAWGAPAQAAATAATANNTTRAAVDASTSGLVGTDQASARAKAAGKPVLVDALTTASSQTTANPDGTFTVTATPAPTRTHTAHGWTALDATLHRNPDGSITPAATTSPITLSGGGTGALARMTVAQRTMTLSLPATLPAPSLSGPTATYRDVLPGVDLIATVDPQGGFSEVLVVNDAAAAANPALASLTLATTLSPDLSLRTDPTGAITASTRGGTALFTAPTPRMWDSATNAATPSTPGPHTAVAAGRALPAEPSSTRGPGSAAHQAPLKTTAHQGSITLTPDPVLLKGPGVVYPVYIDPTFSPNYTIGSSGWATVPNPIYYTGSYWNNTPDPDSTPTMQVGNSGTMWSHTLFNLPIPVSLLRGANITAATLGMTQLEAYSCTESYTDLYAPGATLNSGNATWASWWPSTGNPVGSVIDRQNRLNNPAGCGNGQIAFGSGPGATNSNSVLNAVVSDVNAGKGLQTFALTGENESSDYNSWKEFAESSVNLTITYEHYPNVPTQPSTSPGGACNATAGAVVIGNDDVTFSVYASTPDPSNLATEFLIYNKSNGSLAYDTRINTGSHGYATLAIPRATIQAWNANGTTTAYQYYWTARSYSDTGLQGQAFSPDCAFTYNPAYPASPGIQLSSANPTLGQNATFTLAQCTGLLASPSTACPANKPAAVSYIYQLDNGPTAQVKATGNSQTITLPMTHAGPNTVTAYAIAAGGDPSPPINSSMFIVAGPSTPYADGDLTGSGHPDLLYPGTGANPGLWMAASDGAGNLSTPLDIGPLGTGINTTGTPADWTGAQILHGDFTNRGIQDVLAYYPAGPHAGTGHLLYGTGDPSPLNPLNALSGNALSFPSAALADVFLGSGNDIPVDLVAAGDASRTTDTTTTPPDLIGINGTATDGYELDLFSAISGSTIYSYAQNLNVSSGVLSTTAPDGGHWGANWSLATAQPGGNPVLLALNTTTGTLWQSTNPTGGTSAVIGTAGTWTQITVPWSTAPTAIAGADVNTTGSIELWTLASNNASATAYTLSGAKLSTETTASLVGPNHEWPLTDGPGATTAVDTIGGTPAQLSASGATWSTDNLFTSDITLSGSKSDLATGSQAVNPAADFTLDAWVNPTASGGVALSQDGTSDSDFLLYPNGSQWEFGINNGNTSTWSYDGMIGGSYLLNVWSHLTVTYDAEHRVMSMYVNGLLVATGSHTPVANQPANAFRIGDDLNGGSHTSNFTGQISQVRTWAKIVPPAQPNSHAASYHQPLTPTRILDTRTGNVGYSNTPASTPVAAFSTTTLQITNDAVTPAVAGAPTNIPTTATAVAVDVTETTPTAPGVITTYPDGTQRPITSSTNFTANTTVTGYQIVPIGLDVKIALYNDSTGTTQLIVDVTGYYTTDASLTGDQTYHPLDPAQTALATVNSVANTSLTSTGKVPAGTTFTLQVTGNTNVPPNATAVAANLITYSQTTSGYLAAYATGSSPGSITSLTYGTTDTAQLSADVPIGTGGKISIYNYGGATDIIIAITGYYTTDTHGDVYHTTNPTRLVDTRNGTGGTTGTINATNGYTITQPTVSRITTAPSAVLATMITVTDTTAAGNITAYGTTKPGVSSANWTAAGTTTANLALPPLSSSGTINITAQGSGTIDLVIDCSGYFATN